MLWSFPAVTTGPAVAGRVPALLDLGLRLTHPMMLRVAGLSARANGPQATRLDQLLPEGTRLLAITQHLGSTTETRAHLLLEDGRDVHAAVTGRSAEPPAATWGAGFGKTWRYPATVTKLSDADTVWARLDPGVTTQLTAPVRVGHCNAPETGTPDGDAATEWARRALPIGADVTVTSRRLDRYGRILGDITTVDGGDYAPQLIAAGHALPYEGGPR